MKKFGQHYFLKLITFSLLIFFVSILHANQMTVAAANSTCTVIKRVGTAFEQYHGVTINYICKSSGRLAKGIIGKSIQVNLYISANKKWMDKMIKSDRVDAKSVNNLWGNSLVIAAPKDDPIKFKKWEDLISSKVKKIMIGDPGTAPFGRYAKQSLQSTGIWTTVKTKVETRKHITLLANTVAKSEFGTVGFLFKTNVNEHLRIIHTVDKSTHKPINYYFAPIKDSINSVNTNAFIKFLKTDEAQQLFSEAGFKIIGS